jgi:hypothetical protein
LRLRLRRKSVALSVLLGAAGFAAGGAAGGAIWVAFDAPHVGFAVMGAVGGASLGLVSNGGTRVGLLALAGAVGFAIGFLAGFFVLLAIWEPVHMQGVLVGALGGAVGGGALGIAGRNWKSAGVLVLVSAVAYGAVVQASWGHPPAVASQILSGAIMLAIWGAVGGASLGAAMFLCAARCGSREDGRVHDFTGEA